MRRSVSIFTPQMHNSVSKQQYNTVNGLSLTSIRFSFIIVNRLQWFMCGKVNNFHWSMFKHFAHVYRSIFLMNFVCVCTAKHSTVPFAHSDVRKSNCQWFSLHSRTKHIHTSIVSLFCDLFFRQLQHPYRIHTPNFENEMAIESRWQYFCCCCCVDVELYFVAYDRCYRSGVRSLYSFCQCFIAF